MIDITNTEVFGWNGAIRGMRNPINSWIKSDSEILGDKVVLGRHDLALMLDLAKKGSSHAKYRRFIDVQMDVLAPLYWWKEFDTYKVGTAANSCSTMHTLHTRDLTVDDFSFDNVDMDKKPNFIRLKMQDAFHEYLRYFNAIRAAYVDSIIDPDVKTEESKKIWRTMIQMLPSSYNQLRTIQLNYEVLSKIYVDRKGHKLREWLVFRKWIETLPYSQLITLEEDNGNQN